MPDLNFVTCHPVDALKHCMARAGIAFDPEREAELRAMCDAPTED